MSTSSTNSAAYPISLVLFCILISSTAVNGTDHIVGVNKGWNPGINYTLWANNQTFYVGDFISFRYQKTQYNVFRVNETGYDNCTTEGATGNWSSGKDFILLDMAKRYYFICGNGQCFNGMKVSVVVHPLPSPSGAPGINSTHSAAAAPVAAGLVGFGLRQALVLGLGCIWFGFSWL